MENWSPRDAPDLPDGLIVFDGACVLCAGWVAFIIPRDPAGRYRFVSIQSDLGRTLARRFAIDPDAPQSNIVVRRGAAWFKGDSALEVWSDLPGWRWTRLLRLTPRPLRNAVYDLVARNRYRLFGRRESCLVPTPDIRNRFLTELAAVDAAAAGSGDTAAPLAPIEAALGVDFETLPAPVREVHRAAPLRRLKGIAQVEGAGSFPARAVARLFGFPPAGPDISVTVEMRLGADGVERWERDFAGRRLRSAQSPRGPGHISERFGPFTFDVALDACPDRLAMRVTGWRIGPLPLPAGLAPRSAASEDTDAEGRFRFDIAITLPLIGRLVRYRGWLRPEES